MSGYSYNNNPQQPYQQGFAPQGVPQGMPPQGFSPQGVPQGFSPQGYPQAQQPQQPYVTPLQPQPPNQLYPQIGGVGFNYGHNPAAMSYPGGPPPTAPSAPMPVFSPFPGVSPTPVVPAFGQPVEWVPSNIASAEAHAQRAVVAGYEGYDGSPLWLIRAFYEGDVIPGKLAIKHKSAYVPWGGKENPVDNFEVCCAPPERIRWVEGRNGSIPPNAIPGGRTASGETLYIGRAKEQGALTPGKIHPSHKNLYISFGGNEIPFAIYEVLCSV